MKKVLISLLILVVVGLGRGLLKLPAVQDVLLARGTAAVAERGSAAFPESTSLRVYVCGSASPLGMGQAQACIAVVTPEHFYLIDSGAGSTDNINRLGLPTKRLQGLLLTHFQCRQCWLQTGSYLSHGSPWGRLVTTGARCIAAQYDCSGRHR
jgi:ribonuclease Z